MNAFKLISGIVCAIVLFVVITIGCVELNLWYTNTYGVKLEDARKNVYNKTKSFNEAKVQMLSKYRLEYMRADEQAKKAIANLVKVEFADYDLDDIKNSELRTFAKDCFK